MTKTQTSWLTVLLWLIAIFYNLFTQKFQYEFHLEHNGRTHSYQCVALFANSSSVMSSCSWCQFQTPASRRSKYLDPPFRPSFPWGQLLVRHSLAAFWRIGCLCGYILRLETNKISPQPSTVNLLWTCQWCHHTVTYSKGNTFVHPHHKTSPKSCTWMHVVHLPRPFSTVCSMRLKNAACWCPTARPTYSWCKMGYRRQRQYSSPLLRFCTLRFGELQSWADHCAG